MNCDALQRRLRLDDPDATFDQAAREHLAACRPCREAFPEVAWLMTGPAESSAPRPRFVAPAPRRLGPRTLTAAAAVLLAVVLVVLDRACERTPGADTAAGNRDTQAERPEGRRQPLASLPPSFERTRVVVRDGVRIESRLDLRRPSPITKTGN